MADGETTPLLTPEKNPPPYNFTTQSNDNETPSSAALLQVGTDELPPPYTPTVQGGIPMINCKVCQAIISLEGKQHLFVVKCSVCSEATPIRAAPPGKKYIRCPCNLLLVCRSGATKILCPRETCKRVITLSTSTDLQQPSRTAFRYNCAYCGQVFMLRIVRKFARCPHCRKLTAVGGHYGRTRGHIFLFFGLLLIAAAIGITVGTFEAARENGGIYVSWIGGFLVGVVFLIRAIYYYSVKTSPMLQVSSTA
ncbi:type II phosphatidylinositol 4 5-bisphosphate 4-phosphatase [Biomphalaria pfeifferi]|uniref:Phosphatidylinositol-4,5-bisphosphate 4-phosphatase n=1 Tax=Biomphalaria pfeifferi TaxID=112525 RepID=A0AAD8BWC7_BIOPF|nr:type II phosphatidylinositol 4 5-bisphosphate 4-phosphatase [Biomphalaria pfeifferi]